ncbi:hypothetical protein BHM03_00025109, partial [Ensete ventricosum]
TRGRRRLTGDPPDGVAARAARDGGNRPSTTEIDRRRPILVLPPGSGRPAYRSAAGPVCTRRYGVLPLGKENLGREDHHGSNLVPH